MLQMTAGIDPAANAATLAAAIDDAARGGAVMLFTPEMSGLIDRDRDRAGKSIVAEEDDRVLAQVRDSAARHGVWVAVGSLAVRVGDRWANRSLVVDASGAIVARYDKIHLFDVDLGAERWTESAAYAAGTQAVVCRTPIGMVGLSVCYDVRFPALYQALSSAGATVLTVPAAFTVPTGSAHWHVLLRARAIENAAFVIAAAQVGHHADGRITYGHSLVVDPWGDVLVDMDDAPGVAFLELDGERVVAARQRVPVVAHRRCIGVPIDPDVATP